MEIVRHRFLKKEGEAQTVQSGFPDELLLRQDQVALDLDADGVAVALQFTPMDAPAFKPATDAFMPGEIAGMGGLGVVW